MAPWFAELAPPRKQRGTADGEFLQEMLPFVVDLPESRRNKCDRPNRPDLGAIERVAARSRFGVDCRQIRIDRQARRFMRFEALKLRVVGVTPRLIAKDGTRQQGLAPECDQALWVQVLGMQSPEPHAVAPNVRIEADP